MTLTQKRGCYESVFFRGRIAEFLLQPGKGLSLSLIIKFRARRMRKMEEEEGCMVVVQQQQLIVRVQHV